MTPFCSCSAIPMLMGLLQLGVPFGVAMSFLFASPLGVFNPVVWGLLGALLGPRALLAYVLTTFVAAVLAGMLLDALGLAKYVKKVRIVKGCCESANGDEPLREGLRPRMRLAAVSAWSLFRQMVPYMLAGVAVGAFIYGFVPDEFLARVAGPGNPFAIPVAAIMGIPMYVRTETMIPIGFALIRKGVSVGAVIALLIGGAGASVPELTMLGGIFKRRLWVAYVLTMFVVATGIGYMFQLFLSL